jgi:hypothetical protein
MNSYTPAADQKELQRKLDAINKCGKNMGPHDYIPIEWQNVEDGLRQVTKLMCRVCFVYVKCDTLMKMHGEVKL